MKKTVTIVVMLVIALLLIGWMFGCTIEPNRERPRYEVQSRTYTRQVYRSPVNRGGDVYRSTTYERRR